MDQVQVRNDQLVSLLSADFQKRYEPNFAWKSACSAHLALPGLRGFWPTSAFDSTGGAQDQSGHGHHLAYNGNPTYNYAGLAPYIALDGTGDFLSRADEADLDITGTETYVAVTARGLTLGGWFYVAAFDGSTDDGVMSKWNTSGNQRSYMISIPTPGSQVFQFQISEDGTAGTVTTATSSVTLATATWYHVVGRYDAANGVIDVYVDGEKDSSAPAEIIQIFNGTANFEIGSYDAGTHNLSGRVSPCFLCAAKLSDTVVRSLYQQTRALYGA